MASEGSVICDKLQSMLNAFVLIFVLALPAAIGSRAVACNGLFRGRFNTMITMTHAAT